MVFIATALKPYYRALKAPTNSPKIKFIDVPSIVEISSVSVNYMPI